MRIHFNFFLATLSSLLFLTSSGQNVVNFNKEPAISQISSKHKDTLIYKIIIPTKDTLYFGSDKKMQIKESDTKLLNILKLNNTILNIQCFDQNTLLINLNLEVVKYWYDTVQVYSPYDQTTINYLKIINVFMCNIKSIRLEDFYKIQSYRYCRLLLNKLLDFKK